ncbi:sugar MFS transporter [Granulicella mallensis]|uniref:Glucose/galactose transporter n=1 Tax=Granulicella mallensis (strain ATCC BAA-1857 / DSM 23137 / MP5ACTX8) TaxID=682795 RepID=G8P260_GRAMM|nr:sugar MFS transporter [Granulicella mallensis]AEU38206.1 glucose/galactose transporter [Granulicella mallensis MP5ACTX8]
MAVPVRNISAPGYGDDQPIKTDMRAMSVATSLFFMVGFLTCLNDIIIPHLKSIFALGYGEAMSVQLAFFTSYFVFSYPGGALVDKFGYKKTMVVGLLVMACGAVGFIPAAHFALFPIFLTALIILAAGMTIVQVAVNPYVTVIGPVGTASSRLNLAQAFNSFGTFIAPLFGSVLILGNAPAMITPDRLRSMTEVARQAYRASQASTVRLPYIGIALTLVLLALALAAIKLKTTTGVSQHTQDFRPGAFAEALSRPDSIWHHPWLLFGAVGIFVYVGAEVAIGSLLVNYMGLPQIAGLRESTAAYFLMVYWGGAMVGRFIGSAVLQKVKTGIVLGAAGLCALLLIVISIKTTYTSGLWIKHVDFLQWHRTLYIPKSVPMFSMLAIGFCNSIMFPSIFTLGIQDLGPLTSKGSSLLIAAIVGGALIPKATGILADHSGLHPAFIIPALCYVYIACFGLAAIRRPVASNGLLVDPT